MFNVYKINKEDFHFSGTGIAFSPSDTKELVNKPMLLFGALNSDNTRILNEISAINDILLKKGILNSEDLKFLRYIL